LYHEGFQIIGQSFAGGVAGAYGSYGHGGYAGDLITVGYTISNPALARSGRFRAFAHKPSDKDHAYKINSVDPEGTGAVTRDRDEPRAQRIALELEKQVYKTVRGVCVLLWSCLWL
jgi:hypothetical protein